MCTGREREEGAVEPFGTCSSATSIDNTEGRSAFEPPVFPSPLSCLCHFEQTCDSACLL